MDYKHVALVVPDLRVAETFYRVTFDMTVLGREAWGEDGEAHALRPGKGWDDAIAAGVELRFVALRRDKVILALLAGDPHPDQVFALGLFVEAADIAEVRTHLAPEVVTVDEADYLEFLDPFGLRWQLSTNREFRHAGQIANRWLDV